MYILKYNFIHQLFEYDDLAAKTDAATERFHTLAGDIQQTEAELSRVSDLMAAVVQYAKTTMAELLGGEKLPKMDVLKEKRCQLAARKLQVSIHLPCLPLTHSPGNPAKNGGSAVSYAPSVPRFSMIALIIPSTSRSSLSLRELS